MRQIGVSAVRPVAAVLCVLLFAAGAGAGQDAKRFDLLCRGQKTGEDGASSFEERLSIDIDQRKVCGNSVCGPLAQADAERVEYRCVVGKTYCPGSFTMGTAGPFVSLDAFTVNRRTGAYRRTVLGKVGDPASHPFRTEYAGTCQAAPFSGLTR